MLKMERNIVQELFFLEKMGSTASPTFQTFVVYKNFYPILLHA